MPPNIDALLKDPERLLLALDRTEYEDSLYLFLRAAWRYIDPAPWTDGWPMEAVAEHLQAVCDGDIKRLIINIPPRTGKTSLFSIAFPAWVWAQRFDGPTSGPGTQFMYASYAEKRSMQDSVACRRLIRSPFYQKFWGDRFSLMADQDTKHRFSNNKGGHRLITSITGTATGEGAQVFGADDPNATNQGDSEATVETTIDWWDGTASTRLNDPKTGAFMVVQQRVAENDLTGHIISKDVGEWTWLCLPMHYDPERSFHTSIGWKDPRTEPGELLWPDRFGEPEVKALERSMGPFRAAGQLEQRPEPAGGGVIKREWWNNWTEDAFPPFDYILASLDTAYTEKTENDPSAMTVWGIFSTDPVATGSRMLDANGRPLFVDRSYANQTPKVMLMSAWREWLAFNDLVLKTGDTCRKLKVDCLLVENKAAGISLEQEMRRQYSHENYSIHFFDPKAQDKLARLHSVQGLFAPEMDPKNPTVVRRPGIVYAPDRVWADMVITEVGLFPKGRYRDLTDTVSQALIHLRKAGLLTLAPERLADLEAEKQYTGKPDAPLYPA